MMPVTETSSSGPYAQAAQTYWQCGWRGILPLPAGRKKPVPAGYTGQNGHDPSFPDIWAWMETEGAGNIALRMPHNVIGIDVDDYGDKQGAATLAAHESMYGPLPATWRSTSRDTRAGGIRLYQAPPGLAWPGELDGGGVEIIQRRHRYAVVAPSTHPEGGTYRWYTPDGAPSIAPPAVHQLPALPERWVDGLTSGQPAAASTKVGNVDEQAAIAWLAGRPGAQDPPCPVMQAVLDDYLDSTQSAHGAMNTAVLTAVRYAEGGHPGVIATIINIRKRFVQKVTSPLHTLPRSPGEAAAEYRRSLTGAVGICLGDPGPATCDCHGQLTTAIINTANPASDDSTSDNPADDPTSDDPTSDDRYKFQRGDTFILDAPDTPPALWGDGDNILWAKGESLLIAGPPGVGKTTLTGQLVKARLGIGSGKVLGHPVKPTASRVLYMAMDRPAQIGRSLRRQFQPNHRTILAEKLMVWVGPPPIDVARNPHILKGLAELVGADTIIIDSLKDAAIGLTEDETGAGYNRARQTCLTAGIEVLELHHMVKRGPDGRKPNTLADVYGSMHITSGAGSVLVLWGSAGDLVLELLHLKQPMADCGPMQVQHDHDTGTTTIVSGTDVLSLVAAAGRAGVSAREVAQAMFQADEVTRNQKQKATRTLQRLVNQGHLESFDGPEYHGQPTLLYRAVAGGFEGTREGTRPFSAPEGTRVHRGYADDVSPSPEGTREGTEGTHVEGTRSDTPLRGVAYAPASAQVRTLTACADCGRTVDLEELTASGTCDDCKGRAEWWQR